MKKFLAYLLVLIMVLAAPLSALAAVTNVELVKNSVARVVAYNSKGELASWGSAVAVGKAGADAQYFITNCHVVNGAAALQLVVGDIFSGLNAMVVDATIAPDLALIRLDTPSNLWKNVTFDADAQNSLRSSDQVFAIGYPGTGEFTHENMSSTGEDATLSGGYASSMLQTFEGSLGFRMDAYINHGSSGGAVVNQDGHLVGIATGGDDGNNFAIYANLAEEMLKRNMIPYEKESPLSMVVIIAVAVALVLVIVVVIVLVAGKKKPAQQNAPIAGNTPVTPMDVGATMPVKKNMPTQRITCIAGPMKGATYDARGTYSFGTNPACSVIIPKGTPGVSGKHCSLVVEDGKVTIKDLNSTYGTYVNNTNTKLTMNASYPLKRGDTFYLGSERVGFMIG